jgi:hypothetical protein
MWLGRRTRNERMGNWRGKKRKNGEENVVKNREKYKKWVKREKVVL